MPHSRLLKDNQTVKSIIGNIDNSELIINTDSRKFNANETFVALVGESFDGFNYIEQVLKHNPRAVVFADGVDRIEKAKAFNKEYPSTAIIVVDDTLKFIQELARLHIEEWKSSGENKKVIGITGSNGKTTHKEMISFILNGLFPGKVLATKGNLNNHIGVPLTIFNLKPQHDIAVIEMGMNHPGEIGELTAIALPEHGMITNIGAAHIEFMKSMENIFLEKGTLYREVLKNKKGLGSFVINADDPYLNRLEKSTGLITYGETNGDVKVLIHAPEIEFTYLNQKMLITNKNISEHHNLKNLVGTALLAMKLFPEKLNEIIKIASSYEQPNMNRSQWIENIFLDAYNANPSSMRVSLKSFIEVMKKKEVSLSDCYFVLGDMNELGEFAPALHKEIAEYVKELGVNNLTFIGRFREHYLSGYPKPTSEYLTKEEFYDEWKSVRKKYKFVFVKASRSLQLESLISIV
jgi:UDP-N-acetylmuramoyl-tripeptide--D-alanyl-D-alanine ligase